MRTQNIHWPALENARIDLAYRPQIRRSALPGICSAIHRVKVRCVNQPRQVLGGKQLRRDPPCG
jgi:hypothetical protein